MITESLAYSTLQAGPEFARWLAERGPARVPEIPDPVQAERDGDTLHVRFNRPQRHNAFSTDARAALLEALDVALLDPSVDEVVLVGNGPSFCSGGDLAEFGTFADPASAHLARTRHSPALVLDELTARLGPRVPRRGARPGARQRSGDGGVLRAGGVRARTRYSGLPELSLGLIPGAGGTVSITRRIGRWRTAYLVLSGQRITRRRRCGGASLTRSVVTGPSDFGVELQRGRYHSGAAFETVAAPQIESLGGAAQGDAVGVLLGQKVADRQLDGRTGRIGVQPVDAQHG